jgi:predicted anti-sigma-YlaC factor YlaD
MATTLRCLTILAAIVLAALLITPTLHAAGPQSVADLTLLNAANRDRAAAGLPALQSRANRRCRIELVAPARVFR